MTDLSKMFGKAGVVAETETPREFTGTMLIADPFYPGAAIVMQDGRPKTYSLKKQVILPITEYRDPARREDFILGVAINIQDQDTPDLKALATRANLAFADERKNMPCLFGGPVNQTDFYLVYEDDFSKPEDTKRQKIGHLMVSHDEREIVDIIEGGGPDKFAFVSGVVQWRKKNLEDQIRKGFFHVTEIHSDLLFDTPIAGRWEKALEKIGFNSDTIAAVKHKFIAPPVHTSKAYN